MSPRTLPGPMAPDSETSEGSRGLRPLVADLLSAARAGDAPSIGQLLGHYREYLALLGSIHYRRCLQPRISPSDVVQETMLRAHRHFHQFRGGTEQELKAWLREILINSLARFVEEHLHAAKRDIRREVSLEDFNQLAGSRGGASVTSSGTAPSAQLAAGEQATLLESLLQQLPEHYREALVLRNIRGLPFEEVAARLNRSPGATRMLWLRAIEKLREVYRKAEHYDS